MNQVNLPPYPEATGGTHWRFENIRRDMDKEPWCPASDVLEDGDRDMEARVIYLGTWSGNSPSGKTYAPWSSNVTREEAEDDEFWRDEYTAKGLEALGMWLNEYDGDLFAVETRPAGLDD